MTPEHNIAALCQRSRDISLEKGWLNPDGTDPRPDDGRRTNKNTTLYTRAWADLGSAQGHVSDERERIWRLTEQVRSAG